MKTFGLLIPRRQGKPISRKMFANSSSWIRKRCQIVLPGLLEAWRGTRIGAAELERQLVVGAREKQRVVEFSCRFLAWARSPQPRSRPRSKVGEL